MTPHLVDPVESSVCGNRKPSSVTSVWLLSTAKTNRVMKALWPAIILPRYAKYPTYVTAFDAPEIYIWLHVLCDCRETTRGFIDSRRYDQRSLRGKRPRPQSNHVKYKILTVKQLLPLKSARADAFVYPLWIHGGFIFFFTGQIIRE